MLCSHFQGTHKLSFFMYCQWYMYIKKDTGVAHLDIAECSRGCPSKVFLCLIYFHNVCLIYINFLSLTVNSCFVLTLPRRCCDWCIPLSLRASTLSRHILTLFFFLRYRPIIQNPCRCLLIHHANMLHYVVSEPTAIHLRRGWKILIINTDLWRNNRGGKEYFFYEFDGMHHWRWQHVKIV